MENLNENMTINNIENNELRTFENEDEIIRRMVKENRNIPEIMEAIGKNYAYVHNIVSMILKEERKSRLNLNKEKSKVKRTRASDNEKERDKVKIRQLLKEGYITQEIADELQRSYSYVYQLIKSENFNSVDPEEIADSNSKSATVNEEKDNSNDQIEKVETEAEIIRRMASENKKVSEIAKAIGKSYTYVYNNIHIILNDEVERPNFRKNGRSRISKEAREKDKIAIKNMIKEGCNVTEIARRLNRNYSYVYSLVRMEETIGNKPNRYMTNEQRVKILRSEAYNEYNLELNTSPGKVRNVKRKKYMKMLIELSTKGESILLSMRDIEIIRELLLASKEIINKSNLGFLIISSIETQGFDETLKLINMMSSELRKTEHFMVLQDYKQKVLNMSRLALERKKNKNEANKKVITSGLEKTTNNTEEAIDLER